MNYVNDFNCYSESSTISLRAFSPSFNVLETSQERDKKIKKVSIIKDKKVKLTELDIWSEINYF